MSGPGSTPGWTRSTRISPRRWPRVAGCRWNACTRSPAAGSGPVPMRRRTGSSTSSAACRPRPRSPGPGPGCPPALPAGPAPAAGVERIAPGRGGRPRSRRHLLGILGVGPRVASGGRRRLAAVRTADAPGHMDHYVTERTVELAAADPAQAWATWAGAVTLVTVADGRDDIGATVSAVCPVSVEPALVLVSLMSGSYPAELFGRAEEPVTRFAVTLLSAGQRMLAGRSEE